MDVQVVSSTTIHASCSPAESSTVPLTIFDKYASDMHVAVLYAVAPPTASNAALKDGLLKTLSRFSTLAGRLGVDGTGRPCIHVGSRGGGALLVEATVATELADYISLEPSPELLRLHPPMEGAQHVFQVQLNRFRCGGLVVGATTHHRVADGKSMSNFFIAWGMSVRGLAVDPLPIFDYRRWLQPRRPPRCEFRHWGVEFVPPSQTMGNDDCQPLPGPPSLGTENIRNISLHYSSEFIANTLKAQTRERYTTVETLLGHLWRKITVARGLAGEDFTQLRVAVNGRQRLRPRPVPPEFFGNLVLNACPRASVKELLDWGIEGAARVIHEALRRTADEYFRSFVDFGEMHETEELMPIYGTEGEVMYPNLEADSWLGFGLRELDFGGRLCRFRPTWIPAEGVVIFIPSMRGDGGDGVDVVVTLFEEHARVLSHISHTL